MISLLSRITTQYPPQISTCLTDVAVQIPQRHSDTRTPTRIFPYLFSILPYREIDRFAALHFAVGEERRRIESSLQSAIDVSLSTTPPSFAKIAARVETSS